jgi:hypothetical protein
VVEVVRPIEGREDGARGWGARMGRAVRDGGGGDGDGESRRNRRSCRRTLIGERSLCQGVNRRELLSLPVARLAS